MELFSNILVPVDGSPQARVAAEMAAFVGRLFKSHITLLHVVSNELPALAGEVYSSREDIVPVNQATYQFPRSINLERPRENIFPDEILRELTQRLRENGQTVLDETLAFYGTTNVVADAKLAEEKDVAEAIISEAERGAFNLIVIGNSGHEGKPADFHLGSVAKKVAFNAKVPVLVVRKKAFIRKILVSVGNAAHEEKLLQTAQAIAKAQGAKVVLLHVQEESLLKLKPQIQEFGRQMLHQLGRLFEGTSVEEKLASGDPASLIIQTAEQTDVDLVVVGGGGLGTLKGLILGSAADHVLHHATFPVLLVR